MQDSCKDYFWIDVEIVKETEKSYQFRINNELSWFPKSLILDKVVDEAKNNEFQCHKLAMKVGSFSNDTWENIVNNVKKECGIINGPYYKVKIDSLGKKKLA